MARFLLQFKVPDVQPSGAQPYQKLNHTFRSLLQIQQQPSTSVGGPSALAGPSNFQPGQSPQQWQQQPQWQQQSSYSPQQFRVIDVMAVSGSIKGQAIIEGPDYTTTVAQLIAQCPILDTGLEWHLEELMPAQDAVQILERARAS